jgi:hypothetical protein
MINARYTYTQDNVPFVCDLSVLCTVLLHNKSSFAWCMKAKNGKSQNFGKIPTDWDLDARNDNEIGFTILSCDGGFLHS